MTIRKHMLAFGISAASLLLASTALAQPDRTALPNPTPPFNGVIADNILDSRSDPVGPVRPPAGAPNLFLFMSDDVGFAMTSAFGGPVPTPNLERLAREGQRYNRFHTTGICSPSRAALLTGRNHHNAGMGYLSDSPVGFPGYGGYVLPETATIAQILRLNGYNTGMWGKHHLTPRPDQSPAGPFDHWPTGMGFENFFGILSADSDQFSPVLHRETSLVPPEDGNGDLIDRRMADDMIHWLHNQHAAAPDKPFFMYWAPGSVHAPHQALEEDIARFKGKFDHGWDKVREETWRRQLAAGIIPEGTPMTPRPDYVPAWDSLNPQQKAFAARSMEVAAAQLFYQDKQLGRVLDEMRRMGVMDNTLVAVVLGDNGAEGLAGARGTINEFRALVPPPEDEKWMHANTDRLGGPMTYGSYPVGWAWAMNTPLPHLKQYASMLGGIRNGMILSWKDRMARSGSICGEFGHLVDIAPTFLEAAQLPLPDTVNGIQQKPLDGKSLIPSLSDCEPTRPRTQYFEMTGKKGLYHNGWFLSGEDGRLVWEPLGPDGARPEVNWTLYHLDKDFSQSRDVAAQHPDRLQAMQELWREEARRNNVYPVDYRALGTRRPLETDTRPAERKHWKVWGKDVALPVHDPFLSGRSFRLAAEVDLERSGASGVIAAAGSHFGGWSLYLDQGRPTFIFARSTDPAEIETIKVDSILPQGKSNLELIFTTEGARKPAQITLSVAGKELARGTVPDSYIQFGVNETLDIGRDIGVPVTSYSTPFGKIEGNIPQLDIYIK